MTLEEQGNFLFKYRGQFPILLFLSSIPFIKFTSFSNYNEIFIFSSVFFFTSGYLIRFYTIATTPKNTSGRNTKKQIAETLNTKGIYSLVRNPLYLGNYLIWLGVSLYTFNIYFLIYMSSIFYLFYRRIIFAEECFLRKKFDKQYNQWAQQTNSFFPKSFSFTKSHIPFSFISILRREYSSLLSGIVGYLFIDFVRNYFLYNSFLITDNLLIISSIIIFFILILRTLKHHTTLLSENDRS